VAEEVRVRYLAIRGWNIVIVHAGTLERVRRPAPDPAQAGVVR
jgi:hypothetical protein